MDNDINKAGDTTTTAAPGGEKLFSQEELNKIISDRLAREREKFAAEVEAQKAELERQTFLLSAKQQLQTKGLPPELVDAVNTSSPESFEKSLELIDKYITMPQKSGFTVTAGRTGSGARSQPDPIRKGMGLD